MGGVWGHQTGDQVLRLVAMTLKSNIRGRDIAARYGGEEFAAILPETDLEGAVILADNIRKAIQGKELLSARPTRSSDASQLRLASRRTARAIRRRPSSSVPTAAFTPPNMPAATR